jgi:hypothetical protein
MHVDLDGPAEAVDQVQPASAYNSAPLPDVFVERPVVGFVTDGDVPHTSTCDKRSKKFALDGVFFEVEPDSYRYSRSRLSARL